MSLINIINLSFSYDTSGDNIFEDVSFQIDTDWRLGFTGRNGRGKTTFLMLLMGRYEYSGTISSSVEFLYFPFEVPDPTLHTIDIARNINTDLQDWEIERELSLLDVDLDVLNRPYNTLSNGEQTKAMLAMLFLKDNGFLLIDEPTNHLDQSARQIVSEYLKTKKQFILVSHDRMVLDNCVDHILSINKANIEVQRGNFSSWYENKQQQDNFELAENEKLKGEIKRLKIAARRASGWSDLREKEKFGNHGVDRGYIGHKAAKMMKRSKAFEKRQNDMIDEKSQLLKNIDNVATLKIHPVSYHSQRLLFFDGVSACYGDKQIFNDITFEINKGDRIALQGKNGSGKSSLIKLILGENITHTGNICVGKQLITSYISQDTTHLKGRLNDFILENHIDETLFKAILRNLDFSRTQFEKDISEYSSGQKKKVLIAKSLCEKAHLYIWDEPLNFIDILSRIQIEGLLQCYKPTLLFVEHDKAFTDAIATKVVSLDKSYKQ